MLSSLNIIQFRCFRELTVENLKRVNLVVGLNNAGKTCLLEALELLVTRSPVPLVTAANRRGEFVFTEIGPNSFRSNADIKHAFFGRQASPGTHFELSSNGGGDHLRVRAEVVAAIETQQLVLTPGGIDSPGRTRLRWAVGGHGAQSFQNDFAIGREGGIQLTEERPLFDDARPLRFLPTGTFAGLAIAQLWGQVAARPSEDRVVDALRIVEPDVERIAAGLSPAAALFVRIKGVSDRVPLGSLGDGASRLLALACQLVGAEHGVLLVDEIDTGLHVSAMAKMWQLVIGAARELDVQVFATTHSDDCLRGLAAVLKALPELGNDVALHRIERGQSETISYSSDEIVQSAITGIEVRQ